MKTLIIGANGKIGKILSKKLKKSHHTPVAMVRKESQKADFNNAGIETILADLEEDFEHAFAGVNTVVFTAGSGGHTGPDKTHLVDRIGAKKAIDFAVKKNIQQFIMVSALGADASPDKWPDSMKHYYEAKADADKHLMQSGLNYTIIKPGRLTDDQGTNQVLLDVEIPRANLQIPRTDVATVIEKSLGQEHLYQQSLELLSGDTPIDDAIARLN